MSTAIESIRQKEANLLLKLQEAIALLHTCLEAQANAQRAVRDAIALELDRLQGEIAVALRQQAADEKRQQELAKRQQELAKQRRSGAPGTGLGQFSAPKTERTKKKPGYKTPEAKKAEKSARDAEIRRTMQGMGEKKK